MSFLSDGQQPIPQQYGYSPDNSNDNALKVVIAVIVVIIIISVLFMVTKGYVGFLKDNGLLAMAFGTGCVVSIIYALKNNDNGTK